jgi:nicotinamidase-related amidase
VTLDSHHVFDVAHPPFWRDSAGKNPAPFTTITASDIESGKWTPTKPSLYKRMLDYAKKLESGGRYPLMVWPIHCLIGSQGATIVDELQDALKPYCMSGATVDFVTKGSNIYTEHYSAVQAEVPDPGDPKTLLNMGLVQALMEADEIAFAGEAGSHCLANSIRDIADGFKDDSYVKKIVLLEYCYSPVPIPLPDGTDLGVKMQTDFIKSMTARGMRVVPVMDYLS